MFTEVSEHSFEAAGSLGCSLGPGPAQLLYREHRAQGARQGSHSTSCPGANTAHVSSRPLQDISKRLSLPVDIRLPQEFLQKLQLESPELPKPLSRMSRRASLVSAQSIRDKQDGTPPPKHGRAHGWAYLG